ncbi:MAG: hypothetical protein M3063_04155 [Actinomycetota bacterium]|nr:hypothetical protein [Actinomycetota bacterium]MDQ6945223.1 hypothetical protein [Actinomycetota bacterium]
MERFRAEAPTRRVASERAERTDIRSGERPGVAVRQITSPITPFEGAPDPRHRRTAVLIAVVVAVVVVALAVAVVVSRSGGAESAAARNPTPTHTIDTASPATIDPQATVRATIIRDYLAAETAFDQATGLPDGGAPNFELPALSDHMVGAELNQVRNYIIGMKAGGLTALGPPVEHRPQVASVTGTTAVVRDCYRSDDHVVDAATHALHDKPGTAVTGAESAMQLDQTSGVWKLASVTKKPELCPAS